MKQKIVNTDKAVGLVEHDQYCENADLQSAEKIDTLNIYWLVYSYPFVPILDFASVFDVLREVVKNRFPHNKELRNIYKKKINETI